MQTLSARMCREAQGGNKTGFTTTRNGLHVHMYISTAGGCGCVCVYGGELRRSAKRLEAIHTHTQRNTHIDIKVRLLADNDDDNDDAGRNQESMDCTLNIRIECGCVCVCMCVCPLSTSAFPRSSNYSSARMYYMHETHHLTSTSIRLARLICCIYYGRTIDIYLDAFMCFYKLGGLIWLSCFAYQVAHAGKAHIHRSAGTCARQINTCGEY